MDATAKLRKKTLGEFLLRHYDFISKVFKVGKIAYFFIAFTLVSYFAISYTIPAVPVQMVEIEVPFLPLHYQVVEDVTNVINENHAFSSSAGVGLPQIERTLDDYQTHQRPDATHYLTVTIDPNSQAMVYLDYYDFQPSYLTHTVFRYAAPAVLNRHGSYIGTYLINTAELVDNHLVLDLTASNLYGLCIWFFTLSSLALVIYLLIEGLHALFLKLTDPYLPYHRY